MNIVKQNQYNTAHDILVGITKANKMNDPRVKELENKYFILYRKRVQRKTGGCKNKWIIQIIMRPDFNYMQDRPEALAIMESFGGEDFGPRSRVFRRYSDAEKAWVYLTLKWS